MTIGRGAQKKQKHKIRRVAGILSDNEKFGEAGHCAVDLGEFAQVELDDVISLAGKDRLCLVASLVNEDAFAVGDAISAETLVLGGHDQAMHRARKMGSNL